MLTLKNLATRGDRTPALCGALIAVLCGWSSGASAQTEVDCAAAVRTLQDVPHAYLDGTGTLHAKPSGSSSHGGQLRSDSTVDGLDRHFEVKFVQHFDRHRSTW